MALPTASDNPFPSILLEDHVDPAAPSSGFHRLFIDTDEKLKMIDHASLVTDFTPAAGGDITTDTAWAAKGDLIVGTAPDTAAILTAGTNGKVLTADDGETTGLKWAVGAAIWTPDTPPTSPHADDDEFDALAGWTTLGSLDTLNVSDFTSKVHIVKNTSGSRIDGIYKAAPSVPFTVTCRISDALYELNYDYYGIMLLDDTPTALFTGGFFYVGGERYWGHYPWSNNTSRGAGSEQSSVGPQVRNYIRMVVTSSTSVNLQASLGGLVWETFGTGVNPGLTVAKVGLFASGNGGSVKAEAAFDWIRFT
jgi:hypothetical protein